MSCNKQIENSSKDNSDGVVLDQAGKFVRNTTRMDEESESPTEELASENQRLFSPRSVKVSDRLSNYPSTLCSHAQNMDPLDKASSSADFSAQELRNFTSSSRSDVVLIPSPRKNPTASSTSFLEYPDASGAKTNKRDLSPFAASCNTDFSSPPEHGTVTAIRSLSKNLNKTNIPSPEKRNLEGDVELTPIKRLRKTPEIDSGEPESQTESYRSKSRLLVAEKASYKSPTNIRFQQANPVIQKNKESKCLNTPSTLTKRKKKIITNISVESKTTNDACLSSLISSSLASNTNRQMLENKVADRNVEESAAEEETLLPFRDCSTDSNSLSKHSKPNDMLQTANLPTLQTEEYESIASNVLADASSNDSNLKTRKQKDAPSTSYVSNAGALLNFKSNNPDTIGNPTKSTDALFNPNDQERFEVSDTSFEVMQSDFQQQETESAVHSKLIDKTSSSNHGPTSKSQNSTTENFESCNKVKKMQDSPSFFSEETQWASDVTDSAVKTQKLKSFQSRPIVLNPHLPSTSYLPRQSNSSVTDARRRILELDISDKKERFYQNRSDSSTRSSNSNKESRSLSEKLPAYKSPRPHKLSLSDETPTSRNSPDDLSKPYQFIISQGLFRKSKSKKSPSSSSSSSRSLSLRRRSISDETLRPTNFSDVQAQQDHFYPLAKRQSKKTSRSLPEIGRNFNRTTCVVQPFFRGILPIFASNTANNSREFLHSGSSNQPLGITETLPSNEPSTSRNNPEERLRQNFIDPQPDMRRARLFLSEISTSINQETGVGNETNPLYIDVVEGQASTSSYQPPISNPFSHDQSFPATSRNEPAVVATGLIDAFRTSSFQPLIIDDSSSDDSSSDSLHADRETTHRISEPFTPTYYDVHPEYTLQSMFLFMSVLKELMLHNGENDLWTRFETLFRRFSESCSELYRMKLHSKLMWYIANRGYVLWSQNLFTSQEMTLETYTMIFYEKFIVTVVTALTFALSVRSSRNFFGLIDSYTVFGNSYAALLEYWAVNNVEDIQDEVSRNRVNTLKKMIQRLQLVTRMAFRLLLMYIGENNEESIVYYERKLKDEDKMYLRRNTR